MVHIYYFEDLICLEIGNEITEDDLGNYLESFEKYLQENKKFGLLFNYIGNKPNKNREYLD